MAAIMADDTWPCSAVGGVSLLPPLGPAIGIEQGGKHRGAGRCLLGTTHQPDCLIKERLLARRFPATSQWHSTAHGTKGDKAACWPRRCARDAEGANALKDMPTAFKVAQRSLESANGHATDAGLVGANAKDPGL
jgi:hypothetical protein